MKLTSQMLTRNYPNPTKTSSPSNSKQRTQQSDDESEETNESNLRLVQNRIKFPKMNN